MRGKIAPFDGTPQDSTSSTVTSLGSGVAVNSSSVQRRGPVVMVSIDLNITVAKALGETVFTPPTGFGSRATMLQSVTNFVAGTSVALQVNAGGAVIAISAIPAGARLMGTLKYPAT